MAMHPGNKGVAIGFLIISIWMISLFFLLNWSFSWSSPVAYLMILVQMHLYTGLFITAHDAMHGTVSSNPTVNKAVGQICTTLYAVFPFKKLSIKHHQHHQHVHSNKDPDYHEGGFLNWYISFMSGYLSWSQIVLMALIFNVLKIWFSEINIILFWVAPSLLSTLQLFYFGTWLPHHGEHENKHQSRTQKKNHAFAFLSCYFFGYHYEHHECPDVPWWRLWSVKES